MMYRSLWVPAALVLTTLAAPVRADDRPPVEVHVLDDGDDVDTRERDASDRPSARDARAREETSLDEDARHARQRLDRRAPAGGDRTDEDCDEGPWFWHKPDGVHQGDLLFTWQGGYGAGGGFSGGSAEWMFHEHFGLRLMGLFDGIRGDSEFHGKLSGWDFAGGAWGLTGDAFSRGPTGFVGLVEPNFTYHFRPGERLDVFASAGVSAFMYKLDAARGGSALLRTGVGVQWFWRALFVGAELGWYPVEIARVSGRRDNGVDVYRVDRAPEAFDGRRATFVAHVGIRL